MSKIAQPTEQPLEEGSGGEMIGGGQSCECPADLRPIVWIEAEGGPFPGRFVGMPAIGAGVFGPLNEVFDNFRVLADEFYYTLVHVLTIVGMVGALLFVVRVRWRAGTLRQHRWPAVLLLPDNRTTTRSPSFRPAVICV